MNSANLPAAFNQMSADLDRLQSARRRMTSDIAHDLRKPLTVIGGYVESMREGVLQPTPERMAAVQTEVKHLERLVEDLRTISQAEAGDLSLNREAVTPASLLQRMVQSYRPLAEKQSIELRIDAPADLPEIHIDPDRMAQVLGNLITNSLRYTPAVGRSLWRRAAPRVQSSSPYGIPARESRLKRCPWSLTDSIGLIHPGIVQMNRGWAWPSPSRSSKHMGERSRPRVHPAAAPPLASLCPSNRCVPDRPNCPHGQPCQSRPAAVVQPRSPWRAFDSREGRVLSTTSESAPSPWAPRSHGVTTVPVTTTSPASSPDMIAAYVSFLRLTVTSRAWLCPLTTTKTT